GVTPLTREPREGPVRIVFSDREERGALRLFLRALRRLPEELPWEAVVVSSTGAIPTLRSSLRERVRVAGDESEELAQADVVVARGEAGAPGGLVRARGGGAGPGAPRQPVYEEVLEEGDLGLLFEPGDVDVLAAQLQRIVSDTALREQLAQRTPRTDLSWSRV